MNDYKLAQERDFDVESAETIKSLVSETPVPDKESILRYMQSFPPAAAAAGMLYDMISGEETGIPILAYIEDGYFWDTRDIYYFDKYNIKLNDDFVNHVYSRVN